MNLSYVMTYLEVVKRGSFSEAAKVLGLSQPSISFQIQRLELELGVRLLERRGGSVAMTVAGKEFHHFAERMATEQEKLLQSIASLQGEVGGRLVLAASTIPGEYLLPRILGEFKHLHPATEASLAISDTADVVEKVIDRQCDIGFIGALIPKRGLTIRKLADDEMVLMVYPGHPFAGRHSVSPSELEDESFVQREEGSGTRHSVEQLMNSIGFDLRKKLPSLVVGSSQAIISAVEARAGIGFVSRLAAEKSLTLGRIYAIPIEGVSLTRSIYYIYLEKHIAGRLLQEFLHFLEMWRNRPEDQSYP